MGGAGSMVPALSVEDILGVVGVLLFMSFEYGKPSSMQWRLVRTLFSCAHSVIPVSRFLYQICSEYRMEVRVRKVAMRIAVNLIWLFYLGTDRYHSYLNLPSCLPR